MNKNELHDVGESALQVAFASMSKNLNRYTMHVGKIYGGPDGRRYKIVRMMGDTVFYKELTESRVYSEDVDVLLPQWNSQGVKEIAFIDEIIDMIRKHLGPVLGPFVMGGLVAWLMQKLK